MNAAIREDSQPWYRQFWPWFLIGLPAITVVAGVATIWLASREPVALVVDDYYKEGMAVNQDLAKDEIANELQLSTQLDFDLKSKSTRAVVSGQFSGDSLKLAFIHPVKISLDDSIVLERQPDGGFSGPLPVRMDRWYLELEGSELNTPWRLKGEIDLRKGLAVVLLPDQS